MGNSNFFSKFASIDPLAQALNLPGAHKYAQQQAQDRAGQTDTNGGAYTGIDATLAGANAGYAPGGPGSTPGFTPTTPSGGGGLFGALQKGANLSGNLTPQGTGTSVSPATPGNGTNNSYVQSTNAPQNPIATAPAGYGNAYAQNPWMLAAKGAGQQPQQWWGTQQNPQTGTQ
jgi:hypothetical protein